MDSNDENIGMTVDNDWLYKWDEDRGHLMDVDGAHRGALDFDDEHGMLMFFIQVLQLINPFYKDQVLLYANNHHSHGEDEIREQDHPPAREYHDDQIMHDPALKNGPQAPQWQSNPSCQFGDRDSTQPHRRVLNTQQCQEATLPSPPISHSTSNRDDENNHNNGTQVRSAVYRGDEHVSIHNMP